MDILQIKRQKYLINKIESIKYEYDYIYDLVNYLEVNLFGEETIDADIKKLSSKEEKKNEDVNTSDNSEDEIELELELESELESGITKVDKNPRIKKLYRKIVKISHPDSGIKTDYIYKQATKYYDSEDYIGLCIVADRLGITYALNNDDLIDIEDRIYNIEKNMNFIKCSYAYTYYMDNKHFIDISDMKIKTGKGVFSF